MSNNTHYIGIGVPLIHGRKVPHSNSSPAKGRRAIIAWNQKSGSRVLLEEKTTTSFENLRAIQAQKARRQLGEDVPIQPYDSDTIPIELHPVHARKGEREYFIATDQKARKLAKSFVKHMNYTF